MRLGRRLFCAAALISIGRSSAFSTPRGATGARSAVRSSLVSPFDVPRGGGADATTALMASMSSVADAAAAALSTGTPVRALGALYAVASLTVVPLTWYRTAYSFSVGYGLSVAAMAAVLLRSFAGGEDPSVGIASAPSALALTALVYGVRLAAFIFARERTVESKRKVFDDMNKTPVLKRTPLALGVSVLYALMMSPAMFALRAASGGGGGGGLSPTAEAAQKFFVGVAALGALLETVADQHKYEVKRNSGKESEGGEEKFVGPTSWSYKLCRHPNYLGECSVLFYSVSRQCICG